MALRRASDVLTAVGLVRDLADREEVAARWTQESACAGMSVGGLTAHLLGQAGILVDLLAEDGPEVGDAPVLPLLDHYRRTPWANTGLDDEANVAIRDGNDDKAADGPAPVLATADAALARLPAVLDRAAEDTAVFFPWAGWGMGADDFLVTRLMELVVHADDLAASVGLPTPAFPPEVTHAVVGLLASVALDRHGQDALVRALSRPQRAPADGVAAF